MIFAAAAVAAFAGSGTATLSDADDLFEPRRVALVVGLDAYEPGSNVSNLRYAAADALEMSQLLSKEGYEVHTLSGHADLGAFEEAWAGATGALQHQDVFLLYFAGHAELKLGPVRNTYPLHLLLSDGASIQQDELEQWVRDLPTQHRVVILDTCYSERTQSWVQNFRGSSRPAATPPNVRRFDAWMFAAAPHQAAQEDPELGHGVFTHFLMEALSGRADLDGDGTVGLLEAFHWTGQQTADYTGEAQVPSIRTERVGWSDLPLAGVYDAPQYGVVPWVMEQWKEIWIDGVRLRGPSSIAPGRRTIEIRSKEKTVVKQKIRVVEGKVVHTDRIEARQAPVWIVGVGARGLPGALHQPAWSSRLLGRWGPAFQHIRLLFGADLTFAYGAVATEGTSAVPVLGADLASAVLGRLGDVEIGPAVALGGAARRVAAIEGRGEGWQGAPRVQPSAQALWRRGGLVVGGDVGAVWMPVDCGIGCGAPLQATFGGWVGWGVSPTR